MRAFAPLLAFSFVIGAAMGAQEPKPGDKILDAYITQEALALEGKFLAETIKPGEWPQRLKRYRKELLFMLGLWPLPKKTPLKPVVTGVVEGKNFVVEKLHFQSMPHLYVTANLYRPPRVEGKLPAVLYACGHAGRGRDGNKTAYQHHGIWLATHGYVCLMIDSLQLGEIAAIHHGTYRENRWWWHSRGYTPAGVECWNCTRALDYLQSRPEVDPERLAVTGRSGGGAYSFWLAATDERVKVAVPVSGMSDLEDYVKHPVLNGHCDCMFIYNTAQWPWTRIEALVAPRPLLFCNSSRDPIFPMTGNQRVIARLRRLYRMLGCPERVDAFVAAGGHKDTRPLRLAAFRWINRFLKGDDRPVTEPVKYPVIEGARLRAFPDKLPTDEINTKIDRLFVPKAEVTVPDGPKALAALRTRLLRRMRETSFRAWPQTFPSQTIELGTEPVSGLFLSEPPIVVGYHYFPPKGRSKTCWLIVLDEGENPARVPRWAAEIVGDDAAIVLSPRGVGPTERTIEQPYYYRRALALLGRTLDSGRVWDVAAFVRNAQRPGTTWKIVGKGRAGIIGAYAALFEPKVAEVVCVGPPASHESGPHFLSVLRVLDIPDALGLLAPRPLTLIGASARAFDKTAAYYRAAGAPHKLKR